MIAKAEYVDAQNARAVELGLPGDLTVEEWATTIASFDGRCAYCGGPATLIEHFIPVHLGGANGVDEVDLEKLPGKVGLAKPGETDQQAVDRIERPMREAQERVEAKAAKRAGGTPV